MYQSFKQKNFPSPNVSWVLETKDKNLLNFIYFKKLNAKNVKSIITMVA